MNFEFDEKDRPLFKALLSELRNVEVNPEWFVLKGEESFWMSEYYLLDARETIS